MHDYTYLTLDEARDALAEIGVELNDRQIRRAAEKDPFGRRKLPFFVDPVDGRLKIEKAMLFRSWQAAQKEAVQACKLEM
jgi:hypothetical protein